MCSTKRLALALLAALPAAGCVSPGAQTPANFGLALQQDLAAQIVEPQGPTGPAPPGDGRRSALAMGRYQAAATTPPAAAASDVGKAAAAPTAPGAGLGGQGAR